MTILTSAYATTVGRVYKTDTITKGIAEAVASKYLSKSPNGVTPIENTQNVPAEIPTFTHPLYIDKTPYDGLYVDVRNFMRFDKMMGTSTISSPVDHNFQMLRAHLEARLRSDGPAYFRLLMSLPMSAYSGLLTQAIAKVYHLEPEDQYVLSILTAHYFLSQLTDEVHLDSLQLNKNILLITRATRATAEKVYEVLTGVDYISSLAEYVTVVKSKLGPRVANLEVRTLLTMLSSSFWINNGPEVVGVGLEHMPTFYAMIWTVINEGSHKRSRLAEVVNTCPAKSGKDSFATQLSLFMKSVK